ncbi:MAG: hypothetical protein JXK93_07830 [Sphaerochaetaceae bacterium]|nr:hypothetical protein [Sphaerochaetaceae bacterium]
MNKNSLTTLIQIESEELLNRITDAAETRRIRPYLIDQIAQFYAMEGNVDQAKAYLGRLTEDLNSAPQERRDMVCSLRAYTYALIGDFTQALSTLQQTTDSDKRDLKLAYFAVNAADDGDYETADLCVSLISREEALSFAYKHLAQSYVEQSMYHKALQCLTYFSLSEEFVDIFVNAVECVGEPEGLTALFPAIEAVKDPVMKQKLLASFYIAHCRFGDEAAVHEVEHLMEEQVEHCDEYSRDPLYLMLMAANSKSIRFSKALHYYALIEDPSIRREAAVKFIDDTVIENRFEDHERLLVPLLVEAEAEEESDEVQKIVISIAYSLCAQGKVPEAYHRLIEYTHPESALYYIMRILSSLSDQKILIPPQAISDLTEHLSQVASTLDTEDALNLKVQFAEFLIKAHVDDATLQQSFDSISAHTNESLEDGIDAALGKLAEKRHATCLSRYDYLSALKVLSACRNLYNYLQLTIKSITNLHRCPPEDIQKALARLIFITEKVSSLLKDRAEDSAKQEEVGIMESQV